MRRGISLIEIIIAVAIIAIIAGVTIAVINPAKQLAASRNTERMYHLQTIMNAVRQNMADQGNESFSCAAGPLPTSSKTMASAAGTSTYDIAPCLIPGYALTLQIDPSATSSYFNSPNDYNLGYTIFINASGTVTIAAPFAELGKTVSVTR